MGDTARAIAELMGEDVEIVTDDQRMRPKNSEVERLFADNGKAMGLWGWQPEHAGLDGFKNGLGKTIAWFRSPGRMAGYKPDVFNR